MILIINNDDYFLFVEKRFLDREYFADEQHLNILFRISQFTYFGIHFQLQLRPMTNEQLHGLTEHLCDCNTCIKKEHVTSRLEIANVIFLSKLSTTLSTCLTVNTEVQAQSPLPFFSGSWWRVWEKPLQLINVFLQIKLTHCCRCVTNIWRI
jgi:hypothetical protein